MAADVSVAIIDPLGGHCGNGHYNRGLCRGLLAAGCRVSLYTCDETVNPQLLGLGFHTVYRRIYGKDNRWLRGLRYMCGTLEAFCRVIAARERIVHFHVFNGVLFELFLVVLARSCSRKVVLTVHDVESFAKEEILGARMIGRVYSLAHGLIVHNCFSRQELIDKLDIPAQKIMVIPHGDYFDTVTDTPSADSAKQTLGIDAAAKVVLFFGQIRDVKGLDLLVEAMPRVAEEIAGVRFVIAGRPLREDFGHYLARIDELGQRDRCSLHIHFIPDDQVSVFYGAADLVVLPYRRIYQSGVLLLAMSYSRAVLVSDLPGMTESVTDGKNGYVFQLGSKNSLAERIIAVLRDNAERQQTAKRAHDYIRDNHDWEQIGIKTFSLYQSVIERAS